MDPTQQFCLRWNNYQSTLQYVVYKLWMSGTFVDASLVVEGRRIDCHKVVLSACSTYFEDILQEHSSQSHPVILLHDMPYTAVEALVAFMYRGEINVTHTQLESLLQVAEALKVKGLADSATFSNLVKRQLIEQGLPLLNQAQGVAAAAAAATAFSQNRFMNVPSAATYPTNAIVEPRMLSSTAPTTHENSSAAALKQAAKSVKRLLNGGRSPGPKKKRPRSDKGIASRPASPVSINDSSCDINTNYLSTIEPSQPSPPSSMMSSEILKQETSDETDGELQIDESAGQSPARSTDGDNNSAGSECDKEACNEEIKVVAPSEQSYKEDVKAEPVNLELSKSIDQTPPASADNSSNPKERKSIERMYTRLDLEQGIEAVLLGRLTPAKAIAHYRIPRRTFFRRLSAVRKSRGIPSAKENAADQFLNSNGAGKETNNQLIQTAPNSDSYVTPFRVKTEKQLLTDSKDAKVVPTKKNAEVSNASNSYFTLLKLAASRNYDSYIKYLKMVAQQSGHPKPEEIVEALKKGQIKDLKQTVDDNRNFSTEVSEAALCLVSKNVNNKVPEQPLSLVNGNKTVAEVPEGSQAPNNPSDKNVVVEFLDIDEAPVNLSNGKDEPKVSKENPKIDSSKEGEDSEDSGQLSPGSPAQDLINRDFLPGNVAEIPEDLILGRNLTANSATEAPQNLVSRSNKMATEVS